jgi:hypothetical protein
MPNMYRVETAYFDDLEYVRKIRDQIKKKYGYAEIRNEYGIEVE